MKMKIFLNMYNFILSDNRWNLYEIYKIGKDDEHIIVLPFGNWEIPDGKLVYDKSAKYLRRRNLRVMVSLSCQQL